jgi:hypothetical protein
MYSITENIYCSQLSSVAILLQPEPVSPRIIQGNDCLLSPSVLSSCGLPFPPSCLLLTVNEARSYFVSTISLLCVIILDPVSIRIPSRPIRDYSTLSVHRSFKGSPSTRCVSATSAICRSMDIFNKDCILTLISLPFFAIFLYIFYVFLLSLYFTVFFIFTFA